MKYLVRAFVCGALLAAPFLCGCEKEELSASATVKPVQEYKEAAAKEIDEKNAAAELDKLEKEIDADTE